MYVQVHITEGKESLELMDEGDLSRFSVIVDPRIAGEVLGRKLAATGAGSLSGDEVLVNVDWIRRNGKTHSAEWHANFDRMLAYALTRGWVDPAYTAIVAHIEYSSCQ
jgi:hypothetical protein